MTNVGFIGLGIMGRPMAENLMAAGHTLFLQSRSGDTPWNQMMAATTLIVLPMIVLIMLAQRMFIRGITTTGLKG